LRSVVGGERSARQSGWGENAPGGARSAEFAFCVDCRMNLAHFVLDEARNEVFAPRFCPAEAILDEKDRSDHQTVQAR
jgi:hypothetical protein